MVVDIGGWVCVEYIQEICIQYLTVWYNFNWWKYLVIVYAGGGGGPFINIGIPMYVSIDKDTDNIS